MKKLLFVLLLSGAAFAQDKNTRAQEIVSGASTADLCRGISSPTTREAVKSMISVELDKRKENCNAPSMPSYKPIEWAKIQSPRTTVCRPDGNRGFSCTEQ